jgi:Tol biopolymer transport system component
MHLKIKTLMPLTILLLAGMACTLLPGSESTPESPQGDAVATAVAATLAASEIETTQPVSTEDTAPTAEPIPAVLKLVYVLDGDAWYWEEGASALQITSVGNVGSAVLSGDGSQAALTRQVDPNHREIWAVNTDGSNLRVLVDSAAFDSFSTHPDALTSAPAQLDWTPDSSQVVFNTRLVFEGPGLILQNDLHLVEASTGTHTELLAPDSGGDFYYSPDGSQIALSKPDSMTIVNSDGSSRRESLTFPIILTYSEYQYYPEAVWLPDSSAVRVVVPPEDVLGDPAAPTYLYQLPIDGSSPITLKTMVTQPFFTNPPRLAGDGSRLAYLAPLAGGSPNQSELHITGPDWTADANYDSGELAFEDFSPDGGNFVYTENGSNPAVGQIGSPPLALTGITLMRDVSWVDGTRFLYLNRVSGSWELWLRELGTPGILLASSTGDFISYDFAY